MVRYTSQGSALTTNGLIIFFIFEFQNSIIKINLKELVMAMPMLNVLSDTTKGILLIAAGTVLLLHTLGIIQKGLDGVIIVFAVAFIVIGLLKIRVDKMVMGKLKEYKGKK